MFVITYPGPNMSWYRCVSRRWIFSAGTVQCIYRTKSWSLFYQKCPTISRHSVDEHKATLVLFSKVSLVINDFPDCKVHGANMGPTWVLSAPCGPHIDPINLAIRVWLWCVGCHFSPWAMKPHKTVEQSVQWAKLLSNIRDITFISI